ncbi:MAG: GTP cyclohydrolase II [Chloroflexi bacterium]|nr:GTP cyclohydrolase II [Chloroflexota bacterium]MBV9133685.1 GTP cyclohydrolase II [Chloroflexota bacterium]MBV9896006.1 GTP cyclohydrolase II [Chloroflexota bacterium]
MSDPTPVVTRQAEATLATRFGDFAITVFTVQDAPGEVAALTRGPLHGDSIPLVRLHSECLTGDVLGSLRCDCGEQLDAALELIAQAPAGVLLYLPQEGRGIGLANKIRAYALQDQGLDTVDANLALGLPVDRRDYAAAAHILRSLGLRQVRLLTNNPLKSAALERYGVHVAERVPLTIPPNAINRHYLRTKADRMGHFLSV